MNTRKKYIRVAVGAFTILTGCLMLILPGIISMKFSAAVCFVLLGISLTCTGVYYSEKLRSLQLSFQRKLIIGFTLILLVLSIVVYLYIKNDENFISTNKWVEHTNKIIYQSEEMLSTLTAMESSVRAYALTNERELINRIKEQRKEILQDIDQLKELTNNHVLQQRRFDTISQLINRRFEILDATIALRQSKEFSEKKFLVFVRDGFFMMSAIRAMIASIQQDEKVLLMGRKKASLVAEENARRIIYFFGFVMLLILVILIVIIMRNTNARIRAEEEVRFLNQNLEKLVEERTQELMKAESKFHYTLDNMMEGAQIVDFNWRYVYMNDAFLKYSRYTREEMIGYTVMEKYPGIEGTEVYKVYQKCFNERVSIHMENRFIFPDNTVGWFELSFQPIPDGIFILSVDITERKGAEDAVLQLNADIAKREKRFRSIIESSNDLISLLDKELVPLYRSPSAERITGWSFGEMEKRKDITDQIHPADISSFKEAWKQCLENPGQPIQMLFRNKHKNGQYIWLEGSVTNMLHDDTLEAVVTNLQNITLRKISEEKLERSERTYRAIASGIPGSVICLFDTDYRYTLIEGDLLHKLGYSKEALLGKKIEEALPPERYARVLPNFERVFRGETFTVEDLRVEQDTISQYVPFKDVNGHVYAAMVAVFDVSELKNAQRALAELNQALEDKITQRTSQLALANKELESFSYSVSHDLRAPLRGIDGWSLALLEDYGTQLDEKAHTYLDRVRNETQRMGELIDDMLKLSRVSRAEVKTGKIDMSALAAAIANRLRETQPQRQVRFTIEPGLVVMGDENLLDIMLTNLLNNAYKFTGKTADAMIHFGKTTETGKITYFIKDNGAGFNMENAKNLFRAFQRMHRMSEFPGTGIGLATVQRIIHLHQGTIRAEAAINEGATFYFTIQNTQT